MVLDSGIQIDTPELSQTMAGAGAPGPNHRKVLFNGTMLPWGGSGDGLGCVPFTHGYVSAVVAVGAAATVPPEYGPPWPDFKDRRRDGGATGGRVAS